MTAQQRQRFIREVAALALNRLASTAAQSAASAQSEPAHAQSPATLESKQQEHKQVIKLLLQVRDIILKKGAASDTTFLTDYVVCLLGDSRG